MSAKGSDAGEWVVYLLIGGVALFFAGWSFIDSDWKLGMSASAAVVAAGLAAYWEIRKQSRPPVNGATPADDGRSAQPH